MTKMLPNFWLVPDVFQVTAQLGDLPLEKLGGAIQFPLQRRSP